MEDKLDVEKINDTDIEYILQILHDYYMKFLNKTNRKLGYFYTTIIDYGFNDDQFYWSLCDMKIITIECNNRKQATLLDIMLEVLFMQNESFFKYYLDWYFESMTSKEYEKRNFLVEDFIEYLITSHMNDISNKNEELEQIDDTYPLVIKKYSKTGRVVKELKFPINDEVFIYTQEIILELTKIKKLKENKFDRVKQLMDI